VNVAIYLRVSTADQDAHNQLPEIERLCATRGWTISHRYAETINGSARTRPELARLLADAHAGAFGAVVVWALDRLSREGIAEVASIVAKLDAAHVALVSVRESWCDTSGPVRDLLVSVMAWVAKQEKARLVERTKAGLDRARAKGKRLGRPPADPAAVEAALAAVLNGDTIDNAARGAGLSPSLLRRERSARKQGERDSP
jgi:DNA invertase Pin-like site-specific DNA recombinase